MNRDPEHGMDWLADQFMRIFAADADEIEAPDGMHRECRRAWRMLQFLRQIIREDTNAVPRDLDRYLNLEWAMMDFNRILDIAMRDALGFDGDCCGRALSDYSQNEYEEACRNLFAPIVLACLPHPTEYVSPYLNAFLSWELYLKEYLDGEVSPQGDMAYTTWNIVCAYMRTGALLDAATSAAFLQDWNCFLLTREWPEREASLQDENERQKHVLAAQNRLLAEQGEELKAQARRLEETNREKAEVQRLYAELQERMDGLYVSLPLAAGVLLGSPDGQIPGKQEKNTFCQRLGRKLRADGVQSVDSRTGVRFYRLDTLHRYCSADRRIKILPDSILARLVNVAILKQDIEGYRPRPDV